MYCPKCGKHLPDGARFCDSCGTPIQPLQGYTPSKNAKPAKAKPRFYERGWFWAIIVILVIIVYPKNSNTNAPDDATTETTEQQTNAYTFANARENFVFHMSQDGISEDMAGDIYDLMENELLCTNVTYKGKSTVGDILWEVCDSKYNYYVSADNDGIYSIRCGSYEMYDGSEVCYTAVDLQNREIGSNDVYYSVIAKEIVSNNLKAPSTAVFPSVDKLQMARNGDLVAVSGYVDSSNSFGVQLREDWVVEFRVINLTDFLYEVTYIQIGSQSVGEFIEIK